LGRSPKGFKVLWLLRSVNQSTCKESLVLHRAKPAGPLCRLAILNASADCAVRSSASNPLDLPPDVSCTRSRGTKDYAISRSGCQTSERCSGT
jgi:hypothetical protein